MNEQTDKDSIEIHENERMGDIESTWMSDIPVVTPDLDIYDDEDTDAVALTDEVYQYRPLVQKNNEIRLLRLLPIQHVNGFRQPPRCTVF